MKTRTGEYNEHIWELGKKYKIAEELQDEEALLCSSSWFHVYSSPILAILLNVLHADIPAPRIFKCACSGLHKEDRGLKEGFTEVKLTSEIELPKITLTQTIAFGILCAQKVYFDKEWNEWANDWLNNNNRTARTAYDTANAAYAVADAAYAAARAGSAAARAADAACDAACDAAYAVAYAAVRAAVNAARAAVNAANVTKNINLALIAKQAVKNY
jgi:hypothetical protein